MSWAVARIDLPMSVFARKNQRAAVMSRATQNETDHAIESESSIGDAFQMSVRYQAFVAYSTGVVL